MEQNKLHICHLWVKVSPVHQLGHCTKHMGLLHLMYTYRVNTPGIILYYLALWHTAAWALLTTELKKCFATAFRQHWSSTLMNLCSAMAAEQAHHQKKKKRNVNKTYLQRKSNFKDNHQHLVEKNLFFFFFEKKVKSFKQDQLDSPTLL